MVSPRWRKVLRDLIRNKSQTIMVIFSIAAGVVGVGGIGQLWSILDRGMADSYAQANPAQVSILTDGFDTALLQTVRSLPGVRVAEARRFVAGRVFAGGGGGGDGRDTPPPSASPDWQNLQLFALPDFRQNTLFKLFPEAGAWPPPPGQIVLERTSLAALGLHVGDPVWVELPDGQAHALRVAGTVSDPGRETTAISGVSNGYLLPETLVSLGEPGRPTELDLQVTGNDHDKDYLRQVAADAGAALHAAGARIVSTTIPEPGAHWADPIIKSQGAILSSMGVMALALGTCLVINTIFALLTQQRRQIGVMKTLGASPSALTRIYLATVLAYSLAALAVGLPLGHLSARVGAAYTNSLLGFDSAGYGLSPEVLALEVGIGLVVPLWAALYPVTAGSNTTVREAISSGGISAGLGESFFDRALGRVRFLSRPLRLSLRNTFRRKGRLMLTLAALGLGGAMVIALFTVRSSLQLTTENALKYRNFDVQLTLDRPLPTDILEGQARKVAGVSRAEGWGAVTGNRVRPGGKAGATVTVIAPPAGSELIRPTLLEGRWLAPGDDRSVVLDTAWLRDEPDIRVGQDVTLALQGKETTWHVVGLVRKVMGDPVAYVTADGLGQALAASGLSLSVQVVTEKHDRETLSRVANDLREQFRAANLRVQAITLTDDLHQVQEGKSAILMVFLSVMAGLMSVIAAVGLTGTMSLSVMERTREIGVLRSVGASDGAVFRIVLAEGVIIGAMSWVLAALLSIPISRWLCATVGRSIFQSPLDFRFSAPGVLVWLGAVIVLSAAASLAPAFSAARLVVRDLLAYE